MLAGLGWGILCLGILKISQSAKVRTYNRVETLNLFVTRVFCVGLSLFGFGCARLGLVGLAGLDWV